MFLKPFDLVPAWTSFNTTKSLFSRLKDKDEKNLASEVVYTVS